MQLYQQCTETRRGQTQPRVIISRYQVENEEALGNIQMV